MVDINIKGTTIGGGSRPIQKDNQEIKFIMQDGTVAMELHRGPLDAPGYRVYFDKSELEKILKFLTDGK